MFRAKLKTDKTVQAAVSGSGDIVSFESAFEKPLADLALNITPVQSGEGDPSPTNIRPISGWTGARIARSNKNLLRFTAIDTTSNGIRFVSDPDTGAVHVSGTATAAAFANLGLASITTMVYPRSRVYIGGGLANVGVRLCVTTYSSTSTQTATTNWDKNNPSVYTPNNNIRASWIRIVVSNGETVDETIYPTVYLDNSTDFVKSAYDALIISWSDSAGTVYGGTLDVVRGKLRVTHTSVRLGDTPQSRWAMTSASRRFYCSYDKPLGGVCICDRYPYDAGGADKTIRCLATNRAIYITNSDYATVEEFYAAEQDTQIVYELATPIEYDLDPVTINTLLGQNNVWADCGEVENLKLDAVSGKLKFKLIQ